MKPQQKLNLVFSIIIAGLIFTVLFVSLSKSNTVNENSDIKNVKEFQLMEINLPKEVSITGLVNSSIIEEVQLKVSGKISKNNVSLAVGSTFKKNEILIKLDRLDALYELLATRAEYKTLIQQLLLELKEEVPQEIGKWKQFESKIQRTIPLPELPLLKSKNEEILVNRLNVVSQYYKTKKIEKRAEEYIYLAPFDGIIIESSIHPGLSIQSGKTILKLAKSNSNQVTTHIHLKDLKRIRTKDTIQFYSLENKEVSKGLFSRIGSTDSSMVKVYYSIFSQDQSLLGQPLKTIYPAKKTKVPSGAIKDGSIMLFLDNRLYQLPIITIQKDKDSTIIEGLTEHSFVVCVWSKKNNF